MATDQLTSSAVGAWVLKCNPATWDIEQFVADGGRHVDTWTVQGNYRSELMAPKDPVVLWRSGGGPESGFVASGVVAGRVVACPLGDGDGYWIDKDAARKVPFEIAVDLRLLRETLRRDDLLVDPDLSTIEVIRVPQLGNPSYLAPAEWKKVKPRLGRTMR